MGNTLLLVKDIHATNDKEDIIEGFKGSGGILSSLSLVGAVVDEMLLPKIRKFWSEHGVEEIVKYDVELEIDQRDVVVQFKIKYTIRVDGRYMNLVCRGGV